MVEDSNLRSVCIREIQKSLKFSAKALIENKIQALGVSHLFEVLTTEIRRKDGHGIIIFQGMQDHTADSIKSLEGFGIAWVEEAQNLSGRSLSLLRPTIRAPGSEIWFTWNPDQPTDAVDQFFRGDEGLPKGAIVVEVNYCDNPKLPQESLEEMAIDRARDPDYYHHVWMGGYNVKSELQVLSGKWKIDEFEPMPDWDGPYFGGDWGFAADPTAAIKLWINDRRLYVERESWAIGLELDKIADRWMRDLPGIEQHVVRADSSRPDTINFVRRTGIPKLVGAEKWQGSVEDGIAFLRNFDQIIVHPQCPKTIEECRLYKYKTNAAGDILPAIVDKFNHCWDSGRYALSPLIKNKKNARHRPIAAVSYATY
jgi:phage terminase large subunit